MSKPTTWRNRIVGEGEEAPDQLLANPLNFRVHPRAQQDAMSGVLESVGVVQRVIVNKRTGYVVDGHMRVALAISQGEPSIPVVYVDLTPQEEALVLATFDTLGADAGFDGDILDALMRAIDTTSADVLAYLDQVAQDAGLVPGVEHVAGPLFPAGRVAAATPDAARSTLRGAGEPSALPAEAVPLCDLKPHPRHYKTHPADQIAHLAQSIRENGLYSNVVTARDLTVLTGHGIVQAAKEMGLQTVPVVRLPLDPDDPRALKVLAGDNEVGHLGDVDDRALTELLKDIKDGGDGGGLAGTGYDEGMLANLAMVTRPTSEIADFDEAAEWVGMPEYEHVPALRKVMVGVETEEDQQRVLDVLGTTAISRGSNGRTVMCYWPARGKDDVASVAVEG